MDRIGSVDLGCNGGGSKDHASGDEGSRGSHGEFIDGRGLVGDGCSVEVDGSRSTRTRCRVELSANLDHGSRWTVTAVYK